MTTWKVSACLLVCCTMTLPLMAGTDDATTARQRIQHAAEAFSLDALDEKPWHAKLSVTVFDDAGKNPAEGTIEYWKSGKDWLRVISFGASVATRLRHDGHSFVVASQDRSVYVAAELFEAMMHPGPTMEAIEQSSPELHRQTFGKVTFDCVMLSHPMKAAALVPIGLFPTYCLDPDADRVRTAYSLGSQQLTVNRVGRFLNHDVPVAVYLAEHSIVAATATVTSLTTFEPSPETFVPTALMKPDPFDGRAARISSGVMAGLKLAGTPPTLP